MDKPLNIWVKRGLLASFFICMGVFYFIFHMYQFGLQEQIQLFLYTPEYLTSFMPFKGWLVKYLSAFLVQFYALRWFGAATVVIIAVLSWWAARNVLNIFISDRRYTFAYALVIPGLLWILFTFHSFYPDRALGFLAALASVLGYAAVQNRYARRLLGFLFSLLLWWFIGEAAFLTAVSMIVFELREEKKKALPYIVPLAVLFLVVPFVLRQMHVIVTVPGIFGFDREMDGFAIYYAALFISSLVTGIALWGKKIRTVWGWICIIVSFGMGYLACFKTTDPQMEILSKIDWMARNGKWHRIIQEMNARNVLHPNSIGYYFLALAQTGQLGDRFLEKGVPLLSAFMSSVQGPNYMGYTVLNEIYWNTGLMRGAQFCNYEAMGVLNSGMSGRHLKRMTESHLVFNEREVAERYLKILSKTTMYRSWAEEQLSALRHDPSLKTVGWIQEKRKYISSSVFLLNVRTPWNDIAELAKQQPGNRMANEYWLCSLLLQKDLPQFKPVFDSYRNNCLGEKRVPGIFQQADIVYNYDQNKTTVPPVGSGYDKQTLSLFSEFVKLRTLGPSRIAGLSGNYLKSYFYYYDFTNTVTQ